MGQLLNKSIINFEAQPCLVLIDVVVVIIWLMICLVEMTIKLTVEISASIGEAVLKWVVYEVKKKSENSVAPQTILDQIVKGSKAVCVIRELSEMQNSLIQGHVARTDKKQKYNKQVIVNSGSNGMFWVSRARGKIAVDVYKT